MGVDWFVWYLRDEMAMAPLCLQVMSRGRPPTAVQLNSTVCVLSNEMMTGVGGVIICGESESEKVVHEITRV